MPFQKDYDFKGITCNYWRVISFEGQRFGKSVAVSMGLYVDDQAQAANEANVMMQWGFDLGSDFVSYQLTGVTGKMGAVMVDAIEEVLQALAIEEAAKPPSDFRNEKLAYFADAIRI